MPTYTKISNPKVHLKGISFLNFLLKNILLHCGHTSMVSRTLNIPIDKVAVVFSLFLCINKILLHAGQLSNSGANGKIGFALKIISADILSTILLMYCLKVVNNS